MKLRNYMGKAALLAAASFIASAASAETFSFANGGSANVDTYGNVWTFTGSSGTKAEVTGYSLDSNNNLYTGWVRQYTNYGLGLTNSSGDDSHTVDNSGRTDILIIQFDKAVTVSQLGFTAWGDTDVSYAIGVTNVAFNSALSFANWAALDAAFGSFQEGNGNNMNDGTYFTRDVNSQASGNLFFVSASLTQGNDYNWRTGNGGSDYVKLYNLTETPAVPEPASWAMMIGGLAVVGSAMRRRKTEVSFA